MQEWEFEKLDVWHEDTKEEESSEILQLLGEVLSA